MPYVNVKLAGTITKEQKKEIAKEITETLQKHAHKPPSYTYIVFEEVKMEDWAIGGSLLGWVLLQFFNGLYPTFFVIPAKAGIHLKKSTWIPAFVGIAGWYLVWVSGQLMSNSLKKEVETIWITMMSRSK